MTLGNRKGFTLVEMLVVIGIIAVLLGAMTVGISKMVASAQKARQRELVSNLADALSVILQKNGAWPNAMRHDGAKNRTDETFTKALAVSGTMPVSCSKSTASDGSTTVTLKGTDRFGVVLPQAAVVLKNSKAKITTPVSKYGTVRDCQLYYAVDLDGDGVTKTDVGRVRASAAVWWSADGTTRHSSAIKSWRPDQEVK